MTEFRLVSKPFMQKFSRQGFVFKRRLLYAGEYYPIGMSWWYDRKQKRTREMPKERLQYIPTAMTSLNENRQEIIKTF